MNTISEQVAGSRRRRRVHSDDFKAKAVASCMQPGMSMAAVAMAHGINANLLRRWVREAETRHGADLSRALPAPRWVFRTNVTSDSGIVSGVPVNVTGAIPGT